MRLNIRHETRYEYAEPVRRVIETLRLTPRGHNGQFVVTWRIDVDKDFIAKLSGLSCKGNDVGGALLASFIDGALKKYEGKTMPLAAFPGERLHMHDLRISVDDSLHVDARFGS